MTTHQCKISPEGMAWPLIALLDRGDSKSRRVAEEQILALCQFYEDNKPEEKEEEEQA